MLKKEISLNVFILFLLTEVTNLTTGKPIIWNKNESNSIVSLAQYAKSFGERFPCEILKSETTPTSVHALMPGDIGVVAAMGDSFTAGTGAASWSLLAARYHDYRGLSWSAGGDRIVEDRISLPNILKKYNDRLRGYSNGINCLHCPGARLNVAVNQGIARDLLAQTVILIDRMKRDEGINFEEDWKVITIEIGAKDMCNFVQNFHVHSPEKFLLGVTKSLNLLYDKVPRALVNLVLVLDIPAILQLGVHWNDHVCSFVYRSACNFVFKYPYYAKLLQQKYNNYLTELVSSGAYDGREDFAVVIQPFLSNFLTDGDKKEHGYYRHFFSIDCMNPSDVGHQVFATGLWNNMLERVGNKTDQIDWSDSGNLLSLKCPTPEQPYFFTRVNSREN